MPNVGRRPKLTDLYHHVFSRHVLKIKIYCAALWKLNLTHIILCRRAGPGRAGISVVADCHENLCYGMILRCIHSLTMCQLHGSGTSAGRGGTGLELRVSCREGDEERVY